MEFYHHIFDIADFVDDETRVNVFSNVFFSPRVYNFSKELIYEDIQDKTYSIHCFNGGCVTEDFKQQFLNFPKS